MILIVVVSASPHAVQGTGKDEISGAPTVSAGIVLPEPGSDDENDKQPKLESKTRDGHFRVSLESKKKPIPISQMHQWVIKVRDAAGVPVDQARIKFDGGMPAHGHGLPTSPRVTQYLGQGQYLLDGVKFNMAGKWKLHVGVVTTGAQDVASFDLELDY